MIELGGTDAGTDHDVLDVEGLASLDGDLEVWLLLAVGDWGGLLYPGVPIWMSLEPFQMWITPYCNSVWPPLRV